MPKLTVEQWVLKDPVWGAATALPGQEIELSATAKVSAKQWIEFQIWNGDELLDTVQGKPGESKVKWTPPARPGEVPLIFDALLHDKPTPKNGHRTVLGWAESGEATLKGYSAEVLTVDEAFVPKQEKLEVKYKITDPGAAAKKGRIVVWGERYPKDEYLYAEDFVPAAGEKKWDTWDGKANNGYLKDKYISPEFSPYRVQVLIGPDEDSVKKPAEKGVGKVTLAEKQFEIKFETVVVRYAENLDGAVATALKPDDTLVVEPRDPKGAYARKGGTPLEKEPKVDAGWAGNGAGAAIPKGRLGIGRIRVAGKRHTVIGESLNQATSAAGDPVNQGGATELHRVADAYMGANDNPPGGGGQTKWAIDNPLDQRPEIPLEIEARLRSRKPNEEANKEGLFEKEAVGPALFDLVTVDPVEKWMFADEPGAVVPLYDEAREYFQKSAWKVKRGEHDAPYNDGTNPVITYWQERFELTSDGQEEVGDTEEEFVKTKKELTVYLNDTLLTRDDEATADNGKRIKKDYAEINNKKIKLRKGLARNKDIVWIVRQPNAALNHPAVAGWANYPPGDNCHVQYGGVRGKAPADDMVYTLRKDFSGTLAGKFKYTDLKTIDLDPSKVDAAKRVRVQSQASTAAGDQQGLAGIIFSPSAIAGDKYVLEARMRECPYARDLGFAAPRPVGWHTKGQTGKMYVWRLLTLKASWRMPSPKGSGGLAAGVGEDDPAAAGRTHPAAGRNMNFIALNQQAERGFNEWIALKAGGTFAAPNEEAHQNVNLNTYRSFFNAYPANQGFYNLADSAAVRDEFVPWDYYRMELPPGIPANRQGVASHFVNALAKGTDPIDVALAVDGGIASFDATYGVGAADPTATGSGPIAMIPLSTKSADEYHAWVKAVCMFLADSFMDQLIPQDLAPASMRVLRWPKLFWDSVWYDGTPAAPQAKSLGIAGYCRGNGQAFFFSVGGNPDTFEHEMGHSLHLAHFAAGTVTNFAWKQHDHAYANCLMGYNMGAYSVPLPAAAVGAAIPIATNPRLYLCPKCLMKIRGWKEDVLPCNWEHPDVF
jgi:hypothetical protein